MKINICKKELDKRKLIEEIQKYETKNNEKAELLMNIETAETLENSDLNFEGYKDTRNYDGIFGKYEANEILIDNNLSFGEVEIR